MVFISIRPTNGERFVRGAVVGAYKPNDGSMYYDLEIQNPYDTYTDYEVVATAPTRLQWWEYIDHLSVGETIRTFFTKRTAGPDMVLYPSVQPTAEGARIRSSELWTFRDVNGRVWHRIEIQNVGYQPTGVHILAAGTPRPN
jgi:hypothetical protein